MKFKDVVYFLSEFLARVSDATAQRAYRDANASDEMRKNADTLAENIDYCSECGSPIMANTPDRLCSSCRRKKMRISE